mmetsp:Transcript_9711/g.26475  ORF Transcript_9711/g.26475 Transcript_9711/m.26475 type:complete len:268 (-) Transcript_9711:567-1370(-)|eukprot:CAMPEP_0198133264 /NCGR_PEP_ID=MMETSP1442-20131203/59476_1 /TAXON_ID= /ORGANISM="Craspedostauros australis, Strain CCMP3328" /LENGTH=267 /DNA_ID=CAMNT_0043794379 /DNA_START=145 /DNA_END=948 /DNA_ORIENTATION=+
MPSFKIASFLLVAAAATSTWSPVRVCDAFQQQQNQLQRQRTSAAGSLAFVAPQQGTIQSTSGRSNALAPLSIGVSLDAISDIGYVVSVQKPLGIVFGENPDPYLGLVVDDVIEAQNGAIAGIRIGDQLMTINGENVIGKDFDFVMGMLKSGPAQLDVRLYRGSAPTLFTILSNRMGEEQDYIETDDDEGDEPVIMDENYESPVKVEVKERKPLGVGDVFKAMKKVGQMALEKDPDAPPKEEKKKGGGLFGFGGDAIQLDGDDASTMK